MSSELKHRQEAAKSVLDNSNHGSQFADNDDVTDRLITVNKDPTNKLDQEQSYVMKDMKARNQAYHYYMLLYLIFVLIIGLYNGIMIIEWSSIFHVLDSKCQEAKSSTQFEKFHYWHMGVYILGFISVLAKKHKGVRFFLIFIVVINLWRFILFISYLGNAESVISDCNMDGSTYSKGRNINYFILVETIFDILAIFLGIRLRRTAKFIFASKNRLSQIKENSYAKSNYKQDKNQ